MQARVAPWWHGDQRGERNSVTQNRVLEAREGRRSRAPPTPIMASGPPQPEACWKRQWTWHVPAWVPWAPWSRLFLWVRKAHKAPNKCRRHRGLGQLYRTTRTRLLRDPRDTGAVPARPLPQQTACLPHPGSETLLNGSRPSFPTGGRAPITLSSGRGGAGQQAPKAPQPAAAPPGSAPPGPTTCSCGMAAPSWLCSAWKRHPKPDAREPGPGPRLPTW